MKKMKDIFVKKKTFFPTRAFVVAQLLCLDAKIDLLLPRAKISD